MIGVGADWQAMDKLKLTASYLYVKNEGNATFGVQNNASSPRRRSRSTSTTSTTASSSTST